MTVDELFQQYARARFPEVPIELMNPMKEAFFAGAKAIVAIAAEALTPSYPGAKHNVKGMASALAQVDQETTVFLRNQEEPAEKELIVRPN